MHPKLDSYIYDRARSDIAHWKYYQPINIFFQCVLFLTILLDIYVWMTKDINHLLAFIFGIVVTIFIFLIADYHRHKATAAEARLIIRAYFWNA